MPYQGMERNAKNGQSGDTTTDAKQEEEHQQSINHEADKKIQGGVDGNRDMGKIT